MLVVAAFSRYAEALDWARRELESRYGPVALTSPLFDFDQSEYYRPEMGAGLTKQFFAFERLIGPEDLVAVKRETNRLEKAYAHEGRHEVSRPLNLDPGYLSMAKWVLASTKDHAHRIYLADGIYAEVTLHYTAGGFSPYPWTYPDYREEAYHDFFQTARQRYRDLLRGSAR